MIEFRIGGCEKVGLGEKVVDFGSGQGRSDFETGGVAARYVEDFNKAGTQAWAKRCRFLINTTWRPA